MTATIHHIDLASWITNDDHAISVAGWCTWQDGRRAARFSARINNQRHSGCEPMQRDDVAAHLGRESARQSGFVFHLPLLESDDVITVSIADAAGEEIPFYSVRVRDLPGRTGIILGYAQLREQGWPKPPLPAEARIPPPLASDPSSPLFSILLPVYNTPEHLLREGLDSVLGQTFGSWELCAVDDGSDTDTPSRILEEHARADARIRWERSAKRGGIARTTNQALAMARGDFIALLDHDDRLLPHALAEFAAAIEQSRAAGSMHARPTSFATTGYGCDALYSDEEKIDAAGRPRRPVLKPDFSPEFLRGVMYVGHLLVVRRIVAIENGGFDPQFDGIQDYEFLLRLSEKTRRIVHIPSILYQWRMVPTSSALLGNIKGDIDSLQARAVEVHLNRTGQRARIQPLGAHRVALLPPDGFLRPPVTIFATRLAMDSPGLKELENVTVVPTDGPTAATEASREHHPDTSQRLVAYLDVPIRAASPGWLDHLAFLAVAIDAGRISPILRSMDDRILEAGRTIDILGVEHALMVGFDPAADGYHGSLRCHREVYTASPFCWISRAREIADSPVYDRVCATAWLRTDSDRDANRARHEQTHAAPSRGIRDPFYNPHFDPVRADYSLISKQ